jgi:hypothetical protein
LRDSGEERWQKRRRVDWIDEDECAGTTGSFGSFQYPGQVPPPAPPQSIVAREAIGGWDFAAPSSLRLDLGKRPFNPLPIPRSLLIGRRLRLGTGERVKEAQPHQRREIVEIVGDPPEQAP